MTTQTSGSHDWPVLAAAHTALRGAVAGIPDGAWALATPCAAWSVTQVLQHAVGDQQAYAGVLTGAGFPTFDPFAPSGRLDGDVTAFLEAALSASAGAFAAVSPDDAAVPVPLPQGPLPAAVAVGAAALDAAVHAWDIAVATGQPSPLDDGLASTLHAVALEIVEPLRGFAYDPALAPATGDTAADALLRHLGRDPHWQRP